MTTLLPIYLMIFGFSYHTAPYYSKLENDSQYHTMAIVEIIPWENKGVMIGDYINSFGDHSKIVAATFSQKLYEKEDIIIESKQVLGIADGYKYTTGPNGYLVAGWAGVGVKYKKIGMNLAYAPDAPDTTNMEFNHIIILTFSVQIN